LSAHRWSIFFSSGDKSCLVTAGVLQLTVRNANAKPTAIRSAVNVDVLFMAPLLQDEKITDACAPAPGCNDRLPSRSG